MHIRKGDLELRLFTTLMTLGTPRDITLRVETFFAADEAPAAQLRNLTAAA